MSNSREKLFTEFTAPTTQEWLDKIQVDLKGADFNKRLVWRTNEGFNVQPFYRREDLANLKTPDSLPGEFPFVRGNKKDDNSWYVRQNIVANDAKAANEKALDVLKTSTPVSVIALNWLRFSRPISRRKDTRKTTS